MITYVRDFTDGWLDNLNYTTHQGFSDDDLVRRNLHRSDVGKELNSGPAGCGRVSGWNARSGALVKKGLGRVCWWSSGCFHSGLGSPFM